MQERHAVEFCIHRYVSSSPQFPPADVLYWWPQMSWDQNEAWMLHAMKAYESLNRTVQVRQARGMESPNTYHAHPTQA